MPAAQEEIKEVQREGIKIKCLSSPVEFRSQMEED
jgi:hypothetical protein